MSYRLGFDGFGWLPDAPPNRGILDWLLALEWVHDNIGQFGGDPARVTIAGQSAGGGAVMTLLTMPRARGLFAAAASISGVPTDIPLERAKQTTVGLAERLNVAPDRSGFLRVSERDLLAAQRGGSESLEEPTADDLLALMRAMDGSLPLGPVVDGDLHVWSVPEGMRARASSDIPLLVGSTGQEFSALTRANRHLFEDHDVEPREHCLDVPFIFDHLEDSDVTRVAGPEPPQQLADSVHAAFVGFVRYQNPGWPPYRESKSIMVFDDNSAIVTEGYESARALRS